jgi:cytochrome bd-type quinol oxidase subunit 2
MEESHSRPHRPKLTLLQMMKLVVFAAAASLCMAPMARLAEAGVVPWPFVLMGEGVGIPLVLALVAFPLVREGPNKDWLIRALLFTSVCMGLGIAIYPLFFPSSIWSSSGATVGTMYFVISLLALPFLLLSSSLRNRP